MVECFCGCGRPAGFVRRGTNRLGRQVADELELWDFLLRACEEQGLERGNLEVFVADGQTLYDGLRQIVHKEADRASFSWFSIRRWLRFSRRSRRQLELVDTSGSAPSAATPDTG